MGNVVQRAHAVQEDKDGVYVALVISKDKCVADNDACDARCAQAFRLHPETVMAVDVG